MDNKKNKIVFVSNYYNHHQSAIAEILFSETHGRYCFIETEPMEEERKNMGWGCVAKPNFVRQSYKDELAKEECIDLCTEADVVIIGSAPDIFIEKRLAENKLTFRYSERYFKEGRWRILDPRVLAARYRIDMRYKRKELYMLCSSAYTAPDCRFIGCYKNKAFKWGYFTEVKVYDDIDKIIKSKRQSSILWVARFLKLKHPEMPVKVAKKLKSQGYAFQLNMIGNGVDFERIEKLIKKYRLEDCVHLLGSMSPEKVREYMEQSEIFLFTSDRNEGWGAVLNESMNSGCAVVANHAIGSVPYLIDNGNNGLEYDGSFGKLYKQVKFLLDDPENRKQMGKNAYHTLLSKWNPKTAAERLLKLIDGILGGKPAVFDDGPCSKG